MNHLGVIDKAALKSDTATSCHKVHVSHIILRVYVCALVDQIGAELHVTIVRSAYKDRGAVLIRGDRRFKEYYY